MQLRKLIILLVILASAGLISGLGQAQGTVSPIAEAVKEPSETNPYFTQFFTEKVFPVNREGDGLAPGTLRAALIQASATRSNNNFILVRIVFDPAVKRVRVTKGPLPEIDGSLTTIDCQTATGRGVIEGAIEDTEGLDPAEEMAGLKITSTGNTIRNCHITGFAGSGISVRGTRNLIEYNTIGYHKDVPETALPLSAIHEDPKTNRGTGILIGAGANANTVQNNEIVANTYNGVELSQGVGGGNKILYNFFARNSGKPIKSAATPKNPQITKIVKQGDQFIVNGTAEAKAEVQLYLVGKDEGEVGMSVAQGMVATPQGFQIATKGKGFVPNHTKILAISHSNDGNSSEFSAAQVIPGDAPAHALISGSSDGDSAAAKTETAAEPSSEKPLDTHNEAAEDTVEIDIPEGDTAHGEEKAKPAATHSTDAAPAPKAEAETTLNVKGIGDKGGQPDSGAPTGKSNEVSSLGI